MQLTSLLRTAATSAALCVLFLIASQAAQAQTETVLYSFCSANNCDDGTNPNGPLAADPYGGFFGTTQGGGISGVGAVFLLSPEPSGGCESGSNPGNGWCENVLYNFCSVANCADGNQPEGSVVYLGSKFGRSGNLYGTTEYGGAIGNGTVFEISAEPLSPPGCPSGSNQGVGGWCETVLYSFCSQSSCTDGYYPTGNIVEDSAGNLYGTVANGVFELSPNGSGGWNESLIYQDGDIQGGLTIDGAGNLYGVDAYLLTGLGDVFKLSQSEDGWTGENIHSFNGSPDGLIPNGPPAIDSAGNVYGTTYGGGHEDYGTVWKLIPVTTAKGAGTYKEKILHSFTAGKNGQYPAAGVTLDSSGNVYGTTAYGGTGCLLGCGTVFELAVSGDNYKYKHLSSFNGTDGAQPYSNPILLNGSGNLYGTTLNGGAEGWGTVFEVTP